MPAFLTPFSFIITSVAGWLTQHQQHTIEYLVEENRVMREQIGDHRLRDSPMTSVAASPYAPS